MISAEDARYIVRDLEPETVVRRAWRAANEDTNAAVVLNMETGELATKIWRPDCMPTVGADGSDILLSWCLSSRWAETERLAALYSEAAPSDEVVVEEGVRACPRHAVCDFAVEDQLKRFEKAREGRLI